MIHAAKYFGWIASGQTIAIVSAPAVGSTGGTNGFRLESV
jgi:hypothetical protein